MVEAAAIIFAFTAGVVSLLSPCSLPLLPGYITYYVGGGAVGRAVAGGVACTLGLLTTYILVGLVVSGFKAIITSYIGGLVLAAALLIIVMGVGVLVGAVFPSLRVPVRGLSRRGLTGFYMFGVAYGLASSGCTLPILLSLIAYSIASSGLLVGLVVFIVYALGIATPLILITIVTAQAKQAMLTRFRRLTPHIYKASGILLIMIGAYLIYQQLTI